ncbi:MAG: YDG domain-containing protein, partial [Sphaerochaeta sp.]|nr:YDG domain-containing protein [Sphaerochaeta sp.]
MKHRTKHISVLLVVLASLLLLLVGCSDMMDRMGEIVLQIEPEDTIRTIVARYSLVGNLENSRASVTFDGLAPGEEVRIPKIASGNWSFTVVAFSDQDCKIEIGRGTKSIILIEGQQVNLKVPVVFVPLPLSVSNPTIPNPIKVYDGNTSLEVTVGTLSGYCDGDDKVQVAATANYNDKSVGSGKLITVTHTLVYAKDTAITGKYAPLADYTFTEGVITAKPLTISAPIFPSSQDKEYDGSYTLPVIAGSLIGVVEGDDVSVIATATYDNKDAKINKVITVTYTISGTDAANYIKPADNTTNTGTITKKPLTFTVFADDKTYNGNADATGSITLTGVIEADLLNVGATGTFTFTDADGVVGSDKKVSVTEIMLTGSEKDNYSISGTTAETVGTITKKTFDMTGITFVGQSPTYDTHAHPLAIGGTLPDGVSVSYSSNNTSTQAGTYTVVASFSVDEENHTLIEDMTATLTIQKRALTTEGTYLTLSKAYDKNLTAQVSVDQIVSGKVRGDGIVLSVEAYYEDISVKANKAITVYYTLAGEKIANYTKPENYTVLTGVIRPIQLSISDPSFAETSKAYDGNDSISTTAGILSGVLLTDDRVTVTARANYLTARVENNKYIKVTYTLSGPEDQVKHYTAPESYYTKTGTITKKALTVSTSVDTQIVPSKTYDGTPSARVTRDGNPAGVVGSEQVALVA